MTKLIAILSTLLFCLPAVAQQPVFRPVIVTDSASGSDAYAGCPTVSIASYTTGMEVRVLVNTSNSAAATFNLCTIGAKTIKKTQGGITTDLEDDDIRANQYIWIVYDGTNFQLLNPASNYQTQYFRWTLHGGGSALTADTGPDETVDRACKVKDIKVSGLPSGSVTVLVETAAATTGTPSWSTLATVALSSATYITDTSAAGTSLAAGTRVRASTTGTPSTITLGKVIMRCF